MTLWLPLILAVLYAIVSMRFSVWRTQKMLDAQSHPLRDAGDLVERHAKFQGHDHKKRRA